MDEKESRLLSFQVSAEEADNIDKAAREARMSRSEYLRQLLLAAPRSSKDSVPSVAAPRDTTVLLHQILFVVDRVYNTIFQMAEMAGAFSEAQLSAIESKSHREGIDFLSTIDQRVARTRRQLAEHLATAPPAAGK
jgi:hypothetical protein